MNTILKIFQKFSLVTFLVFLSYEIANAQENENRLPSLDKHVFVPSYNVRAPFTNTYFRSNLGVGTTLRAIFPLLELEGEPVLGIKGNLLFANLGFSYQQKVRDWVAFQTRLTLNARIGTDVLSLLSQGVNTVTSFQIGWIFKVWEGERHMLSATVDIQNYSGNFISITKFVEDIINNQPNPSLSRSVPALSTGFGLRFGYAISEVTGLRLATNLDYGESFSSKSSDSRFDFGGALDFNFYSKYNVPLGLVVGYNGISATEIVYLENNFAHLGSFNIIYTGTPDFTIGIENSIMKLPIEGLETDPVVFTAIICMVYVFN